KIDRSSRQSRDRRSGVGILLAKDAGESVRWDQYYFGSTDADRGHLQVWRRLWDGQRHRAPLDTHPHIRSNNRYNSQRASLHDELGEFHAPRQVLVSPNNLAEARNNYRPMETVLRNIRDLLDKDSHVESETARARFISRSEEHTSELQSRSDL